MRLLFLSYAGGMPDRIATRLDAEGVPGYTRIDHTHGHGLTGPREGNRAWPGEVTVFAAVVPAALIPPVTEALRKEAAQLPDGERLHVAVMPVETFF